MSEVPIQLIVAAFDNEQQANEALKLLKEARKERLIGIQDAAVLRKDEKGKLHVKETGDWGGGKGAAAGGAIGATLGLILGPGAIITGAVGAVIGGLAAKLRDSGFSDARLKKLGEGLIPGSSAIVAVIEHKWVGEIENMMAEAGADVVTEAISADIAQQLQTGKNVIYSATTEEGVVSGALMAEFEDEEEEQEDEGEA